VINRIYIKIIKSSKYFITKIYRCIKELVVQI